MSRFKEQASDTFLWLKRARGHRRAAKLLQPNIEEFLVSVSEVKNSSGRPVLLSADDVPGYQLLDSYWLLAASAVECALKGVCIEHDDSLVTDDEFKLKTHNLLQLAMRAGLGEDLTGPEALWLEIGHEKLKWSGTFHTPLKPENQLGIVDGAGFFDLFDRVYSISTSELEELHKGKVIGYQELTAYLAEQS